MISKERNSEVERKRAGKIGKMRIAGERKSEWLVCCWDGKVCSVAGRNGDGGWKLVGMGKEYRTGRVVDDPEWDEGVELEGNDSLGDFTGMEAVCRVRKFPGSSGTGNKNGRQSGIGCAFGRVFGGLNKVVIRIVWSGTRGMGRCRWGNLEWRWSEAESDWEGSGGGATAFHAGGMREESGKFYGRSASLGEGSVRFFV